MMKEETEQVHETDGMEDISRTRPSNSTKESASELTETEINKERTYTGLHQVLCVYFIDFSLVDFWIA